MAVVKRYRHKWADAIHAWAEGRCIESRVIGETDWEEDHYSYPQFNHYKLEFRVKPDQYGPIGDNDNGTK